MNLSEEEQQEVLKVMKSQMLTLLHGEYVSKFEEEFARYIGVKHAIAVNTGTAALHMAIAALNIGPLSLRLHLSRVQVQYYTIMLSLFLQILMIKLIPLIPTL